MLNVCIHPRSVVIIDPLYARVSFQLKFLLAVLVSAFGQCHPMIVLLATAACLIVLFGISACRSFSNVLSLNCVRLSGLGGALVSVCFGIYVREQSAPSCNVDKAGTFLPEPVSNVTFVLLGPGFFPHF